MKKLKLKEDRSSLTIFLQAMRILWNVVCR